MLRLRRVRTAGLAAAALAAAASAPILASHTSARMPPPPARETVITMLSEGEWVGGGVHRLFYPGNASIRLYGDARYVSFDVSGGTYGDYFTLDFAAPPGRRLRPGLYRNAQRAPFREAGRPGIDIGGSGRGCNRIGGRFDVKDIAVRSDGSIARLWLTFEQHCEHGLAALFGEVRYRMPTVDDGLLVAPTALWWPDRDLGANGVVAPVWVVNSGASDVSVAGTAVRGRHAADFPIRLNDCEGLVLAPGDVCEVLLRFQPNVKGPRVAQLAVSDDRGRTHSVALDGFAYGGRTRFTIESDPGDYIGQGQDWVYTPTNATIGVGGNRSYVSGGVEGADGSWWGATFAAPPGDILVPGETYQAIRYPFNGTSAGMDVSGNGRGCNQLSGTFTVTALSIDASTGRLRHAGIRYEQHCEHAEPAARGVVEFRVPTGDVDPPDPVSNVRVVREERTARVSWTNPPDADLDFVLIRYLRSPPVPGDVNAWRQGPATLDVSATIRNVSGPQPLTVAVYTVDRSGNVGPRVVATA